MSAPTMSMNKVIHCAVRRDLRRFRTALDAFPDGDRRRAGDLHRAWKNFDTILHHHHEGEHETVWPALTEIGVDRELLDRFDEQHDAMAAAMGVADRAMAALAASASRSDAEAAAAAMADLESVTVSHLDDEEAMSEPLFRDRHDDPVLKAMGRKLGKQPLPFAGTFFAWVQDGAGPEELAAFRSEVPGPVVAIIGALFGRRYRREIAPVWATSGSH